MEKINRMNINGVTYEIEDSAARRSSGGNVTPQMYGAKADGVTDDTAAIQSALDYSQENGIPLYFPSGTYLVSKTLHANKKSRTLNIFGCGMDATIKTSDNFTGDYVFWVDVMTTNFRSLWVKDFALDISVDTSGFYFAEIGMKSVIENLWIKNSCNDNASTRAAIYCDSATVTTFERIKIAGFSNGCGIVIRGMHSSKIIECDITYCKYAVYLSGGSNNMVVNCRIDENEYGVFQNSSNDIKQENNIYHFEGSFKNFTIKGNRFEHNSKYAVYLIAYGNGYLENAQVTISENYFVGLTVDSRAIGLGRCNGITVSANYFKGDAFDNAAANKYNQNLALEGSITNITLSDNSADQWYKDGVLIKSNPYMSDEMRTQMNFIRDIEYNQTSRKSKTVERKTWLSANASGSLDATRGELFVLGNGVEISGITFDDASDAYVSKEITLIAGGSATVKASGVIKLKDGTDFVMGSCDTLTLVRAWVDGGVRWVEKCRNVVG